MTCNRHLRPCRGRSVELVLMLELYEEVENCENKMETLIALYMEKLELLRTCTLDNEEDRDEHIKDCYIQIKELNIRQYGEKDKRSLKALRNLVILLTRKQQYDDALANLETVEKVESELFGLKSKQIAKTYSLKGTLYLRNGDKRKAKQYFQKSEEIYKELGDEEGAKKTHEKLVLLNQAQ